VCVHLGKVRVHPRSQVLLDQVQFLRHDRFRVGGEHREGRLITCCLVQCVVLDTLILGIIATTITDDATSQKQQRRPRQQSQHQEQHSATAAEGAAAAASLARRENATNHEGPNTYQDHQGGSNNNDFIKK
jgi:hypothetical protein